jgi:WD40 repeat protein
VIHQLGTPGDAVWTAEYSRDGQRILTSHEDGKARIWSAKEGILIRTLTGHTGAVYGASFSPDGSRIVTASFDNTARIWSTETGQLLARIDRVDIRSVIFSRDSRKVIAVSSDDPSTVQTWNSENGKFVSGFDFDQILNVQRLPTSISISRDGTKLFMTTYKVSTNFDSVSHTHILNIEDGSEIAILKGTQVFSDAVLSADGTKVLATKMDAGFLVSEIWNVEDGERLTTHKGNTIAWSPDSTKMVIDGSVARVADVSLFMKPRPERIRLACERLRDAGALNFTPEEMRRDILNSTRPPDQTDPCNRQGLLSWAWWQRTFLP